MATEAVATPLTHEHALLGATLVTDALGRVWPERYAGEPDTSERDSVELFDVTGSHVLLVGGASAPALTGMLLTCDPLAVGGCAGALVLTGDGACVSGVLAARTGECDHCLWCLPGRADALDAWVQALARTADGDWRAFPDVTLEDATAALPTFLVAGEGASRVLGDYLEEGASLPAAGRVASVSLDGRPCVVCATELAGAPAWLVAAPEAFAVPLWRSLLSFRQVRPRGREALLERLGEGLRSLELDPSAREHPEALGVMGLVSRRDGFVGARALREGN